MKPDKTNIDSYEYFVLGNSRKLEMTRMLKVTIPMQVHIDRRESSFRFALKKKAQFYL